MGLFRGTGQTPINMGLMATHDQPVDMEAAQEFMQGTLEVVDRAGLAEVEAELQEKGRRLQAVVELSVLQELSEERLHAVLRSIFATRRRSREILEHVGPDEMKLAIQHLLYDDRPVAERFQEFVDGMTGFVGDVRVLRPKKSSDSRAKKSAEKAALEENMSFAIWRSELLHFHQIRMNTGLWTSAGLWDPKAGTGAMPLVTLDEA